MSETSNSSSENTDDGYLYCISNPMYKYYGDNVYKLGRTSNVQKRIANYSTGYIEPVKLEYTTGLLNNNFLAEKILFDMLYEYRLKRDFFNCNLSIIQDKFDMIERIINNNEDYIFLIKN
jgi:hypothetical protein